MRGKKFKSWCEEDISVRGYLLEEWDYKKNTCLPSEVAAFAHIKVFWKCPEGHSYDMVLADRTTGYNCPYCRGLRILKGYNDLKSQRPDLMEEWDYTENERIGLNPEEVGVGAGKKAFWICKKCRYHFKQAIENRTRLGQGCPDCAGLVHHSLVGKKFGRLTVIKELEKFKIDGKSRRRMVLCRCDCGNDYTVTEKALKSGNTQSCGCYLKHPHDIENKSFLLYKITCPINGKVYIGKTSQSFEERSRKGNGYKGYRHTFLYDDIQLYGWDAFEKEVLEDGLTKKEAAEREKYYIKLYDTMNREKGYNQNEGGDSSRGYKHDKDVIESLKNKTISEQTRKRQSEAAKVRMKKYDYTEAHKKASETTKARGSLKGARNAMAKAVEQYDLDWNYIATYPCMRDAAIAIGAKNIASCAANIGVACRRIKNGAQPDAICFGFHWKYKEVK